MKVGVNAVVIAPDALVEVAVAAERLGYESLWSGEHVAFNATAHDDIVRRYGGRALYAPDSVFLEPLITLSHLAAVTTTLRLGIGIFLLPLREPLLVGRAIATLDVLSKGRLDLGVGLGWYAPEFEAVGVEFRRRGRRTDELIDALDELFTSSAPEFHGTFFDFGPIGFEPKPVQRPRPPFHIGGNGPAAFERAANRGDGWYGGGGSAAQMAEPISALRRRRAELGRTGPFEVSSVSLGPPPNRSQLDELMEAGVDRAVVTPFVDGDATPFPGTVTQQHAIDALERYAESVSLGA
ncbi:MAG: TIGR03619 family F420-dependent LLM class oxidoreductase [Acidimicrobiia bacterium]